jgi:Fe2+ transport system protein FeoA
MTKPLTTLDTLPARAKTLIAGVTGHGAALIKARAIGLREGRSIEVIARSGRLILALVGNSRIALTLDLARHIQVRAL